MIIKVVYAFILFFEIMTVIYIVGNWLFNIKFVKEYVYEFLEPILKPFDYLTKKSVMVMPIIELSPILLLIVLIYIEQIIYKLL